MDAPVPGGLGGTYAGHPLALAAAEAVIDIMHEDKLPERGQALGDKLKARVESLRADVPEIRDVRGLGAMVAVEFMKPGTDEPDADFPKKVQRFALEHGLILLTCGTYYNVVRFLFPLTIEDDVFDEALDILEAALKA
ncbi:aminotransferase class III-fold pyridoxal phosphate-dependent enzyme [Paludibacterium denitrificans]|uniref:aminotransferase class III-fold pyridoxal phosphate-dependent enzyme n=1 Tax=Paludibacterium denitrificans TaxID=2675226 RepID=UPI0028AF690D|nr:aminotransferase class III-fold pyridoxal phosphate-dependent enzyme [Paludibacterium denitrificans]